MCEFCENKKPLILELQQLSNGIFRVQCFINHGVLEVSVMLPLKDCDTMLYTKSIDTYFCPVCGRELSEVYEMTNKDIDHAKETIDKLTEELKHSKDYITQLNLLDKEAQAKIAELESELEVKDNLLKIKNGLLGNSDDLPTDPIEVAQMLINATFEYEASNLEKALFKCGDTGTTERYSIDDLEQIAEHLLVYCKHNREDEKQ